ncbi:LAMI_0F08548g1_1 [Lachancea mirantina]|uniref:LAMI_0F08548g1_1 n=1 Tax=Lachancea mirantina TaxID=1230905 RepID=A0A1G4K0F9_9SACH|nr:LAMI_0F08548g1_1 [Lachancea mirantina]
MTADNELDVRYESPNSGQRNHSSVIQMLSSATPQNLLLLNQILRELAHSLNKPVLEFIDSLIERIMIPRGQKLLFWLDKQNGESLSASAVAEEFQVYDLGHGKLLEMIYLRQLVVKILNDEKSLPKVSSPEYASKLSVLMEHMHALLIALLKELSGFIHISETSSVHKKLVEDHITNFRTAFDGYKSFNEILEALAATPKLFSPPEEGTFKIEPKTIAKIKNFTETNKKWCIDLLLDSNALREFFLLENDAKLSDDNTVDDLCFVVTSEKFICFNRLRKERLRISHRRVF